MNIFDSRADKYNDLTWATDINYLDSVIQAAKLKKTDTVLDVGTGTGLVARSVEPHVAKVIGLDISLEMLKKNPYEAFLADARDMRTGNTGVISDNQFDKVIARMVFHHITQGAEEAAIQCYRVLKPGGLFILSEGIPPRASLADWYTQMFRIKEDRLTFLPVDLVQLLQIAGFSNITPHYHIQPQVSLRNWIENSNMDDTRKALMWETQMKMTGAGWAAYKATVTPNGDILKDFHFCTVVGEKVIS